VTKYTLASQRRGPTPPRQIPAVWRGIGCLLILVVPLISYVLGQITISMAIDGNWPVPYQLMGYPILPGFLHRMPGIADAAAFVEQQENLYAILLLALLYVVAIGAIISFAYALIYRMAGPPRYGPLDAPPPSIKTRRYKR
jgi:amino acid transporter